MQPAASVDYGITNVTCRVIENHIINLAQLLVVQSVYVGPANVLVRFKDRCVLERAVMCHESSLLICSSL